MASAWPMPLAKLPEPSESVSVKRPGSVAVGLHERAQVRFEVDAGADVDAGDLLEQQRLRDGVGGPVASASSKPVM